MRCSINLFAIGIGRWRGRICVSSVFIRSFTILYPSTTNLLPLHGLEGAHPSARTSIMRWESGMSLSRRNESGFFIDRSHAPVLVYLSVHPEHRRRGIARQLINWGESLHPFPSPPYSPSPSLSSPSSNKTSAWPKPEGGILNFAVLPNPATFNST